MLNYKAAIRFIAYKVVLHEKLYFSDLLKRVSTLTISEGIMHQTV